MLIPKVEILENEDQLPLMISKKAFNRVQHSLVIQDLYDMHTPNKLLKILFSYLRSMFLSYNGASSSQKMLPGGTTQGAYLGGIIFLVNSSSLMI